MEKMDKIITKKKGLSLKHLLWIAGGLAFAFLFYKAIFAENSSTFRAEKDKLQEAMRVRDDDVAWLRGHVAQLTQQLALPPSQEEAKTKHWWRFWRRG